MTTREWLASRRARGAARRHRRRGGDAADACSRGSRRRSPCLTAGAAAVIAVVALAQPGERQLGRWIVLDPAGGLLVGVIGVVGLASALVSAQYLAGRRGSLFRAARADRIYWATLFAFWAVLLAVPLAGNLGAAWVAIEATTAASALLVGFSGRARALEAGWKYLILTSLGLGVALLGILMLEAAAGGGGLETLTWRSLPHASLDPADDRRRLRPAARRPRRQDRLGTGPQLAARRPLRGAGARLGAPLGGAPAGGAARRLALAAGARTDDRRAHRRRRARRLRPRLARGRRPVPLALAGLEAAARLLEPRAHGRDRARDRLRRPARPRGRRRPHRRSRAREGARLLRRDAAARLTTRAPRATRSAASAGPSRALGASLGISLGALAGLPPSPLFVSEVLIVAGGFQVGRPWAAGAAAILLALGFLGLAHALVDTVIGRPRGRDRHPALGLRARHDAHRRRGAAPARPHRRGALAARFRDRRRPRAGARMSAASLSRARRIARRSRLRSPTAGASRACTPRPPTALRRCGRCSPRPTASSASRRSTPRAVPCRRSSTSPRRRLGRARGARSLRRRLRRPRAAPPSRRARRRARRASRRRVQRRGSVSGRRRADPRGRDRVRPLPLPRRRRPRSCTSMRGCSTSTAASSAPPRACSLARRAAGRRPRVRRLLGDERRRLRARLRGRPRALAHARARARPHDPARARARLEHPQRHRRDLRRRRARCGDESLRRPRRRCPGAEREAHRPPVPVRLGRRRRQRGSTSTRRRWRRRGRRSRASAPSPRGRGRRSSSTARSWTGCPTSGSSTPSAVQALGVVGVAARAAGVAEDVRATSPRLAYDGFRACARCAVPPGTCRPVSSSGRSSCSPASTSSTRLLATPVRPSVAARRRPPRSRSGSAVSRARAGRPCASSSATATGSAGSDSAPARTPTGPPSPSRRRRTCCPTSPSSTRASSSATPASTADADAAPRPPASCDAGRARLPPPRPGRSPSATSTAARATAVSTS